MTLQLHPAVWERVMVLSPHPDDATLATGGWLQQALARGAAIHVVFITNGDNNPWLQRVRERRWHISQADRIRWGLRRRIEALAAFATLGVPSECATFLGYRDHGLTRILFHEGEQLSGRLASLVREWRPSLLVVPSARDAHPDHSAVSLLTRRALSQIGTACPQVTVLNYVIHGPGSSGARLQLALRAEHQAKKAAAIRCHTSQLVLSCRRFLAFAQDWEAFYFPAAPLPVDDEHPVYAVRAVEHVVSIEVRWRSWLQRVLPAKLYLVGRELVPRPIRYAIALPRSSGEVRVCDALTGEHVASGEFHANRQGGELRLPPAILPLGCFLFVKVAHRHRCFDRDGWREIVIPSWALPFTPLRDRSTDTVSSKPVVCCVIP